MGCFYMTQETKEWYGKLKYGTKKSGFIEEVRR
jgi:hypothetical protein